MSEKLGTIHLNCNRPVSHLIEGYNEHYHKPLKPAYRKGKMSFNKYELLRGVCQAMGPMEEDPFGRGPGLAKTDSVQISQTLEDKEDVGSSGNEISPYDQSVCWMLFRVFYNEKDLTVLLRKLATRYKGSTIYRAIYTSGWHKGAFTNGLPPPGVQRRLIVRKGGIIPKIMPLAQAANKSWII